MNSKLDNKRILVVDIVLIAVLAGLTAVLDLFGVLGLPFGIISVSAFYFGAAFYLLFFVGFKLKGALGIYLGAVYK